MTDLFNTMIKDIKYLVLFFVIFCALFLFMLFGIATDNYNFCIPDEDAESSLVYKALQLTLFDRCTENEQ